MKTFQYLYISTFALLAAVWLGGPTIARADITGDLAGHWALDEGGAAGKVADSSGSGLDAKPLGLSAANWVAAGKVGGALKFNGKSEGGQDTDRVEIPGNKAWQLSGSSTIALWFKRSKVDNGRILCHGQGAHRGWGITYTAFALCASDGGGEEFRQTFYFPADIAQSSVDAWTHLAVVLDRDSSPNRVFIYVDGKLAPKYPQEMKPGVGGDGSKDPLYLGARGCVPDSGYDGLMDDVRIYTRALSADDVAQLVQYIGTEKLVGWHGRPFREDAAANNGSITNTVTGRLVRARFAPPKGILKENTHYAAKNVPPGLVLQVELASDTEAVVSLKGKAASHRSGDGKEIQVEFLDAAFVGGAANIWGRSAVLGVNYTPNSVMSWSDDAFREAVTADDGSMAGAAAVTLANDRFALPKGALTEGTHYTATNVPAGLKLEIAVVSDTNAALSLSGKAEKHLGRDSVDNLQVRFLAAAFAGNDATDVVGSSGTLSVLCSGYAPEQAAADIAAAKELRELTGAPARMVWARQQFKTVADPYGWSDRVYLMALDTEDGQGIRRILPEMGPYGRPVLSPDGQRVYYGDRTGNKTYVVDFKGGTPRLVTDKTGHVHSVVTDPATGGEWVYTTLPEKAPLVRFEAKSGRMETVWDKGSCGFHHLQVSPDGRKAAIGVGGRNNGVLDIPSGEFTELSAGCWPAMLPGVSPRRVSIFQGTHSHVMLYENPGEVGKPQRNWKIAITDPDVTKGENMHPRWSNRDRFLVMTSPYLAFHSAGVAVYNWKNHPYVVASGGHFVQVCVGRLSEDLTKIEKWVQVTTDKTDSGGNWNPDLWISTGTPGRTTATATATATASTKPNDAVGRGNDKPGWPSSQRELAYIWRGFVADNQVRDESGKSLRLCGATARGIAWFGPTNQVILSGGALVANEVDQLLVDACRKSNQLSLELRATPVSEIPAGKAPLAAFSGGPGKRNFVILQYGKELVLEMLLSNEGTAATRSLRLCAVVPGKPFHLVITCGTGTVTAYLNGKRVAESAQFAGDFSAWTAQPLAFGREGNSGPSWQGVVNSVAVYSRVLSADEVLRNSQALVKTRPHASAPAGRVRVTGKLLKATPLPPDLRGALGTYPRALAVSAFEVEKVVAGTLPQGTRRILVAQWAALDREFVPRANARAGAIGKVFELVLDPWAAHPQLDSDLIWDTTDELDLPMFFDIHSAGSRPQ